MLGMGRPSTRFNASQFLMRRSSSGAFSIASDISEGSNSGTPTRAKDGGMQYYLMLSPYTNFQFIAEFRVPMLPLRSQYTPSTNTMRLSPEHSPGLKASETLRSVRAPLPISGKHAKENRRPESFIDSNARSGIPTRTNTNRFSLAIPGQRRETDRPRQSPVQKIFGARASLPAHLDSPIGRFERDFIEVDRIGSGEFGSVIKVRYKDARKNGDRVYALKRSKPFEGSRHR